MDSTPAVPDHERQDSSLESPIRRIAFRTGVTFYVTSFFLPAMGGGSDPLMGWECAWAALVLPLELKNFIEYRWILFACGPISPLLVSYLLLRTADRNPTLRRSIAVVALAIIPLNWVYMALAPSELVPSIGHFVWIAGLLLILVSDAVLGPPSPAGLGSLGLRPRRQQTHQHHENNQR